MSALTECFTLSYKSIPGTKIELDLYLPPSQRQDQARDLRPVLVYFHGGGLTVGEKTSWFPSWLHGRAMAAGFAFVSADYRLLPPATGHDLVEDIKDLFLFIQMDMNNSINARGRVDGIDSQRIAVIGTSAGGLCAYLAGIHAQPKPNAIISMYGMGGNFFTSHYLRPKMTPFFRGRELLDPEDFSEYLHPNSVNVLPVSSSPLSYHGQDHVPPGYPSNPRMLLARLYLQLGTFLDYYTGDHMPSISKRLRAHLATGDAQTWLSLVPIRHRAIIPQFNATAFPPTFFVHGSGDTAVPILESLTLCETLQISGVHAILRVCEGMEHSFDYEPDAEQRWGAILDEAFQFVKDRLRMLPEAEGSIQYSNGANMEMHSC